MIALNPTLVKPLRMPMLPGLPTTTWSMDGQSIDGPRRCHQHRSISLHQRWRSLELDNCRWPLLRQAGYLRGPPLGGGPHLDVW